MKITFMADGRLGLQFDYSPKLIARLKAIPGMTWDAESKSWCGYVDAAAVGLGEDCFGVGEEPPELPVGLAEKLRNYQREGVSWLVSRAQEGCLLADVMGAGKTVQAVRAVEALGGKTVIVCPSFVRGVWARELKKWWTGPELCGEDSFVWLEGLTAKEIDSKHVILVHYDILHAWVDEIIKWGPQTVVFDECHYLSNEKSQRSKAAKKLARACKYRIGLSGTPMTNRPKDLWNVVDTLSPGRFGSFFKYAIRYCGAVQKDIRVGPDVKTVWDFDGKSNLEELRRRLSHFMLRRTHEDISLELPPRIRQVVSIKVPAKSRLLASPEWGPQEMRRALDLAADYKLKEVIAMIAQHVEDGQKVVAFCHRRHVAEKVAQETEGLFIHGGLTQAQREERIELAAKSSSPIVLAATIDVASVGIDLSFASVAVFVELTWEPHELAQAEARLYRFGQQKSVLVQYTIAMNTSEELIRDGVLCKLDTIRDATGDDVSGLSGDLRGSPQDEADALREMWEAL